jgi:hypothetical protein
MFEKINWADMNRALSKCPRRGGAGAKGEVNVEDVITAEMLVHGFKNVRVQKKNVRYSASYTL